MSSINGAPEGPVAKLLGGTGTFLDDRLHAAKAVLTRGVI